MSKRPTRMLSSREILKQHAYMSIAKSMSALSTCNRRAVGCAIVSPEGFILSTGYNGSPTGMTHCKADGCMLDPESERCIRSLHAEINAIISASRFGTSLENASIYVTARPCLQCTLALIQSGVKEVIYGEEYESDSKVQFERVCEEGGLDVHRIE